MSEAKNLSERVWTLLNKIDLNHNKLADASEMAMLLKAEKGAKAEQVATEMTKDGPIPLSKLHAILLEDAKEGTDNLEAIERIVDDLLEKKKLPVVDSAGKGGAEGKGDQSEDSTKLPVLYEVNISIPREDEKAYRAWLNPHVAEMLTYEGFQSCQIYRRHAADEVDNRDPNGLLTCVYTVKDRQCVDNYIKNHSAKMRAQGISKFPNMKAARRILHCEQTFSKKA